MTYCGLCGNRLVSSGLVHDKTGTFHRKYRCRTIDAWGAKTGCGRIARVAEPVEHLVAQAVLYRYDSEDMAKAFTDAAIPEVGGLLETYTEQKSRLDNIIAEYASGLLNREQMAQAEVIVEEAIETTRAKMSKLESGRTLASIPLGETIQGAWRAGDLFWRRNLLSLVVEKVILQPGRAGGKQWLDPEPAESGSLTPLRLKSFGKCERLSSQVVFCPALNPKAALRRQAW